MSAKEAVAAIVEDLSDRRGLSGQWDMIDDEMQVEITEVWERIILEDTAKLTAENARLKKLLAKTIHFREFTDEWHDMNNPEVVEFIAERAAALTPNVDAGKEG
jgi:hypothetical protein